MLQKSGAFSCTIWAKHTPAKPEFTAEFNQLGTAKRKQLLERVPTNRRELYSGTGIGINCLRLCVGSRVRCSRKPVHHGWALPRCVSPQSLSLLSLSHFLSLFPSLLSFIRCVRDSGWLWLSGQCRSSRISPPQRECVQRPSRH